MENAHVHDKKCKFMFTRGQPINECILSTNPMSYSKPKVQLSIYILRVTNTSNVNITNY